MESFLNDVGIIMGEFLNWQAFFLLGILFGIAGWSCLREWIITRSRIIKWVAIINGCFVLLCLLLIFLRA